MSGWRELLLGVGVVFSLAGVAESEDLGLGTRPTAEQIAGWNYDVRPDGVGLPPGGATAEQGEELYQEKCASCHGDFGEGIDRWPMLAGGFDSLTNQFPDRPEKTVGSYWPYATTLYDYIRRAMPFPAPKSLTLQEVYALTAYVLYLNDIVEMDEEVSQKTLPGIRMPNRDGFVADPRPDTPVGVEPCMRDCPVDTTIVGRAAVLEVTPDTGAQNGTANE